ncbi:MAG: hypothetical protein HN366_07355 [Deltaproteobacteria bacterium]|nr:hypothetical protein [Deltaproteobacteria bacterium]
MGDFFSKGAARRAGYHIGSGALESANKFSVMFVSKVQGHGGIGRETVNTISLGSREYDMNPPICLSNLLESGRTVPR